MITTVLEHMFYLLLYLLKMFAIYESYEAETQDDVTQSDLPDVPKEKLCFYHNSHSWLDDAALFHGPRQDN